MKLSKKTSSKFRPMAQSLTCLILFCTACSIHATSQTSSATVLQSSIQSNKNLKDLEEEKNENLFAYINSIMKDVMDHKDDPSIEITRIQENDCLQTSHSDSQETFTCIVLTFKDFPGNPPYSVHSRRLLQEDPNAFLPRTFEQTLCN